MTQSKKGNQWYFGMKAHVGVDDASGLVHTVVCTTAKRSGMSQFENFLHGDEARISQMWTKGECDLLLGLHAESPVSVRFARTINMLR